ncbi:MAG: YqgE/AlgH family protein [Salinivirgaceae bacterium]|jgi:putative transcriptional regulator|nr:YqgE/AlgH family protein [Salinivirgaceae bacterium]
MGIDINLFNINHYLARVEKGKCLISEPFSPDSYFGRSIVLITEHSENEGTLGYILNKPVDIKIHDLFPEFPEFNAQCFVGGPVNPETIHYLHNRFDLLPQSTPVTKDVYWGGDFELLKEHIEEGRIGTSEIRFYLGYSGWASQQLYQEIEDKFWIVSEISSDKIMHAHENIWKEILNEMGDSYSLWANAPTNPALN